MNDLIFFFFYNFAHQSVSLDKFFIFLAVYFPYAVGLLAIALFLFYYKSWREFFIVFFSAGLAWLVANLLKIFIHTLRPSFVLANVQSLFVENNFAFPSGHASFFSALAVSIFLLHKKPGYWFMIFAFLIGIARIVTGVHFPVDILGGFVLGSFVSVFVSYIFGKFAYSPKSV